MTQNNQERRAARLAAVQALYQMEMSGEGAEEVAEQFVAHRFAELSEAGTASPDEAFFTTVLEGVPPHQEEIDRARAQIRAQLLMGQESPAARAGQMARQMMLYGRPIPNEEMMERLGDITRARLTDPLAPGFWRRSSPVPFSMPSMRSCSPSRSRMPFSMSTPMSPRTSRRPP